MPQTHAELIRCIFESLALKYKDILEKFRVLAPFPIEKLHIIGGGSKNRLLDQFTANAIGIPVVAGPSEATAIGNIMLQARAAGCVGSLPADARYDRQGGRDRDFHAAGYRCVERGLLQDQTFVEIAPRQGRTRPDVGAGMKP